MLPVLQSTPDGRARVARMIRAYMRPGEGGHGGAFHFATVDVASLSGLVPQTEPRRLEPLRSGWDERLYEPLVIERVPLRIHEGNHRLTVARERGYRRIEIAWWRAPESLSGPAAVVAGLMG